MQEQSIQNFPLLASTSEFSSMPYLSGLFEAIDELIMQCAEDNSADLDQLKQFVSDHVAGKESKGQVEKLGKKEVHVTDWHVLMGMALKQRKRSRIDGETLSCARHLRDELNGNDQDRATKLRAEVDERKADLERKKKEKAEQKIATALKNETTVVVEQYHKDTFLIKRNLFYMYKTYGSHIVISVANEDPRNHQVYQAYNFGNTGKN